MTNGAAVLKNGRPVGFIHPCPTTVFHIVNTITRRGDALKKLMALSAVQRFHFSILHRSILWVELSVGRHEAFLSERFVLVLFIVLPTK